MISSRCEGVKYVPITYPIQIYVSYAFDCFSLDLTIPSKDYFSLPIIYYPKIPARLIRFFPARNWLLLVGRLLVTYIKFLHFLCRFGRIDIRIEFPLQYPYNYDDYHTQVYWNKMYHSILELFLVGKTGKKILQYLICSIRAVRVAGLISVYSDHVNSSHT